MQTNILTEFGEDWIKILASSLFTSKILQILRFNLVIYFLIAPDPGTTHSRFYPDKQQTKFGEN